VTGARSGGLSPCPIRLTLPGMAMKRDLTPQQLRAREMMKHVVPAYDRATVNFDRIAMGTGILCVECKACGKRAALTRENCAHIHPGNKTQVRSVAFKCSRIDCGSTDVRRYGGCDLEEAKMWLAGDPWTLSGRYRPRRNGNARVGDG
jgi:hypothetical protein